MPIIIQTYKLSLTLAAFLPFSFFLAYGIMSIPAGIMIERIGEKKSMLIAFSLNLIGSLAFSFYPSYAVALGSLFTIGAGMAMLQVIINPLMRTAGGEENFAFYSVMAQLIFGLASFLSPFVYSYLMDSLGTDSGNLVKSTLGLAVGANASWTSLYWLFTAIFVLMLVLLAALKMPVVKLKEEEKGGASATYFALLGKRPVWLFFLGIVAYVGTEQSLANWMSEFLRQYHGLNPGTEGAKTVAWFWGSMTIGCFLGLGLLKFYDAKLVLKVACLLTVVVLTLAIFGSVHIAMSAFIAAGFTISVMFSIIFSLALNSVPHNHGSFSGILCTGIFGGALIPLIVGVFGDMLGLRSALTFLYLSVGYIAYLAFYAKPIIENKTLSLKEVFK